MGGGEEGGNAIPTPATTASNHHSPPSQTVSSNLCTETSDFVNGSETKARGSFGKTNFGPAPSQTEVQNAISDLRRVMDGFCTTNSEKDGVGKRIIMEQLFPYDSSRTLMRSLGEKRLLDAYHLLQTDASVQRLVASISSDAEVWDAILKNNAVQDLQGMLPQSGTKEKAMGYDQELDSTTLIVKWIFAFMRLKFMELIEKLEVFVVRALQSMLKRGNSMLEVDELLEEKVRSSLLLSIVVLLVVVVTRIMEI
ncbi:hypothetical protein L6452_33069 [Arctium lappa]|uniref:Uncharacterized protein n=1 Tax=Arctium lappa TaxID=4217 RepID=A0ACB8Z6Q2_ARCLA|nr:hypothetical protein L6452_33069 [Arctium lappa]